MGNLRARKPPTPAQGVRGYHSTCSWSGHPIDQDFVETTIQHGSINCETRRPAPNQLFFLRTKKKCDVRCQSPRFPN